MNHHVINHYFLEYYQYEQFEKNLKLFTEY